MVKKVLSEAMGDFYQPMDGSSYYACPPEYQIQSEQAALDLVAACGEARTEKMLILEGSLPEAFFDLKTGLAGTVLLKFSNYFLKVATVISPQKIGSGRFAEFASETRRSHDFRIFYDDLSAINWLTEEKSVE
jgi:PadR family transcriptional regulator, regulatory protein AphA